MKNRDPDDLLPLAKPAALGLGVDSDEQLDRLFRANRPSPPVLKISGKNFIRRADRDAFRDRLISQALRDAMSEAQG